MEDPVIVINLSDEKFREMFPPPRPVFYISRDRSCAKYETRDPWWLPQFEDISELEKQCADALGIVFTEYFHGYDSESDALRVAAKLSEARPMERFFVIDG